MAPHARLSITAAGMKGRDGDDYIASDDLLDAVNVAIACDMPLLLTGEPGCGKTDFAYAVASVIAAREGRPRDEVIFDCAIRSDSRARDLLYNYDAVHRFSDAQLRGHDTRVKPDHPARYMDLQAFGRALLAPRPTVVLLDEIDKAPRDLPNDLLRVLEDGWFEIPELPDPDDAPLPPEEDRGLRRRMARPDKKIRPLVIITSNQEQQLPEAFLRRCAFHYIAHPGDQGMRRILRAHFDHLDEDGEDTKAIVRIAGTLRDSRTRLRKKPGTAEVLRWVQALRDLRGEGGARACVVEFARTLDGKAPADWSRLPAMQCLVKLVEDLEALKLVRR